MALRSMTGWGKAQFDTPEKKVTVEVRSLNSKQLDFSLKIPPVYRDLEPEIRNLLTTELIRGKVDVMVLQEYNAVSQAPELNKDVLEQYYHQVTQLADKLNIKPSETTLVSLMRLPEVIKTPVAQVGETEITQMRTALAEAMRGVTSFREQEGASLEKDFRFRIDRITKFVNEVEALEPGRLERYRERLHDNLSEFLGKEKIDQNRFEQEVIYYLDRIDITEEKVRLRNHLRYFIEVLDKESQPGKKLVFIAQEIGREINTMGSKANDSDIQRVVVEMKDELEKIREQLMNIL